MWSPLGLCWDRVQRGCNAQQTVDFNAISLLLQAWCWTSSSDISSRRCTIVTLLWRNTCVCAVTPLPPHHPSAFTSKPTAGGCSLCSLTDCFVACRNCVLNFNMNFVVRRTHISTIVQIIDWPILCVSRMGKMGKITNAYRISCMRGGGSL